MLPYKFRGVFVALIVGLIVYSRGNQGGSTGLVACTPNLGGCTVYYV
jgi:hypothetical protein